MRAEDRSALFAQLRPMMDLVTPEAAHPDAEAWLEFLRGDDRAEQAGSGRSATAWAVASACGWRASSPTP